MPQVDSATEFFAITLVADDDGRASYSVATHWVGWQDDSCRVELRQAQIVDQRYARAWQAMGQPFRYVTCYDGLLEFLLVGGHGLVERAIAEVAFPGIADVRPAHYSGRVGFVDLTLLEAGADKRAPTPKLRMAVLNRDNRRCRVCGRRPDDNVDIVLNVHHIRPWAKGGATEMSNLLTLCHTCHAGLDPHFDPSLFDYVDPFDANERLSRFENGVTNYRRITDYQISE